MHARPTAAPVSEQYPLAKELDADLTAAMRAACRAARRDPARLRRPDLPAEGHGQAGLHRWTDEAERLLTMRETYRLTGFPARLEVDALGVRVARIRPPDGRPERPLPAIPAHGGTE